MERPFLHTALLSAGYKAGRRETIIQKEINLDIAQGHLVCMVGVNGVGKSTLLRTVAGLQKALSGEVWLDGTKLSDYAPAALARKIAVVLTERSLPGSLSVAELVSLGRHPYTGWSGNLSDDDRAKITESLAVTGIADLATKKVSELSDGQRQRAMIARALAQDTPFILLDEPTAHLDLPGKWLIFQLLHRLTRDHGKTILATTHHLDLALRFADQVCCLHLDRQPTNGAPEDLLLDGTLEKAFGHDELDFDQQTAMFRPQLKLSRKVKLQGPEPQRYWTANALQRIGFAVTEESEADLHVSIEQKGEAVQWSVQKGSEQKSAASIEDLLDFIQGRDLRV